MVGVTVSRAIDVLAGTGKISKLIMAIMVTAMTIAYYLSYSELVKRENDKNMSE